MSAVLEPPASIWASVGASVDYRRRGRVLVTVYADGRRGHRAEGGNTSITPRQARHFAIKLLAAAERAERRQKSQERRSTG